MGIFDVDGISGLISFFVSGLIGTWNTLMDVVYDFLGRTDYAMYFGSTVSYNPDNLSGSVTGVLFELISIAKAPATALAILFWFYGMFKQSSSLAELKRPETLARHLVRFCLTLSLINFGPMLVAAIWNIGTSLATDLFPSSGGIGHIDIDSFRANVDYENSSFAGETANWAEEGGTICVEILFMVLVIGLVIAGLLITIKCAVGIIVNVFKRFFTMALYTIVSPLALASAAYEGTQRTAIQFGKNVTATSIELAMTVLLLRLFSVFTDFLITSDLMDTLKTHVLIPGTESYANAVNGLLAFMLCIVILNVAIKSLNSSLDSMFGLHGV